MKRLLTSIGLLVGFVFLFGSAIFLQTNILDQLSKEPNRFRDSLYLPSSQYVKLITIGYDQFAADFLWLRAIQTFGATFAHKEALPQLVTYFDVITDLDPHFIYPYSFGNMVIGEDGGDHIKALALLDKGIKNNPDTYRLAFDGAFYSFWTMDDPARAREYAAKAALAPDCPDFVRNWVGYFDLKMGRYLGGYEQFVREFSKAFNEGNEQMVFIRRGKLLGAIDDWYVKGLRDQATLYFDAHHQAPTVAMLNEQNAFKDEAWPDVRLLNAYIKSIVDEGKKFPNPDEVWAVAKDFIFPGGGYGGKMPPSPISRDPKLQGYIVWAGQEPYLPEDSATSNTQTNSNAPLILRPKQKVNPNFVSSEIKAAFQIVERIKRLDSSSASYREKHGGECPPDLKSSVQALNENLKEPWGGEFKINEKCEVISTTHPDLVRQLSLNPPL